MYGPPRGPGQRQRLRPDRARLRLQMQLRRLRLAAAGPPPPGSLRACRRAAACPRLEGGLHEAWAFVFLFLETSSIHGLNHLTARGRSRWEYVLWAAMVALAVAGCCTVSLRTLRRYEDNPTVISLERDYKTWNTTFPSATLCPRRSYDSGRIAEYVQGVSSVDDKALLQEFLQNLTIVSYDTFRNLQPVPGNPVSSDSYQAFVHNYSVRLDFSGSLSNSDSEPTDTVVRAFTERGLCYTYNSVLAAYSSYEYWANGSWGLLPPGPLYYGNPMTGERYTMWYLGSAGAGQAYLHAPGEAPDCARRGRPVAPGRQRLVHVAALATRSTAEVAGLRLSQRRCRFPHESPLPASPAYSFQLCRMDCRRRLAAGLCGCAPYFYRRAENIAVCNDTQMQCLAEYNEILIRLLDNRTGTKIKCGCLPLCDDINYSVQYDESIEWIQGVLQWGIVTYPQMRLKRDILFGFTDLLVSIGGTAGLFLGCSVLSFVEIFYFFTLRLFWYIVQKRKTKV